MDTERGVESSRDLVDHPESFARQCGDEIGNRYKVVRPLGRGSLGETYEVCVDDSQFRFNVRLVPPVPENLIDAFRKQPFPVSRHLVHAIDICVTKGECAIVTEAFPRTLRQALRADGALDLHLALEVAVTILRALVALEASGIIPLVVSPEAIALWPDGAALDEYYLPRLAPPGVRPVPLDRAVHLAPDLDPENPRRSDALYGLGATLFEMITGEPLLSGGPFEIVAKANRRAYRIDRVPRFCRGFVEHLLAPTDAQRYPRAEAALADLENLLRAESGPPETLPLAKGDETIADQEDERGPTLAFVEENGAGLRVFERRPEGVRMVLLPGGTFRMGSTSANLEEETPPIDVAVGPFLIDEHPVSWRELSVMLGRTGKSHPLNARRQELMPSAYGGDVNAGQRSRWHVERDVDKLIRDNENLPVVMVTHEEATRLASLLGLELPSEAEWEYAYRAGTTTEYWWGDEFDAQYAWCEVNASGGPKPIGEKPLNPFGLCDIAGNVAEMCRDSYHRDAYARAAHVHPGLEPLDIAILAAGVQQSASNRSVRGGSWDTGPLSLRAAYRTFMPPDHPKPTVGFRFMIRLEKTPPWAKFAFERPR